MIEPLTRRRCLRADVCFILGYSKHLPLSFRCFSSCFSPFSFLRTSGLFTLRSLTLPARISNVTLSCLFGTCWASYPFLLSSLWQRQRVLMKYPIASSTFPSLLWLVWAMDSHRVTWVAPRLEQPTAGVPPSSLSSPAGVTSGANGQEGGVNRMEGPDLHVTGWTHTSLYLSWEQMQLLLC